MPARRPEIRDITYDEHDVVAGFRRRTWGAGPESERLLLNAWGALREPVRPLCAGLEELAVALCAARSSLGLPGRDQFGCSSEAFHTSRVRAVAPSGRAVVATTATGPTACRGDTVEVETPARGLETRDHLRSMKEIRGLAVGSSGRRAVSRG